MIEDSGYKGSPAESGIQRSFEAAQELAGETDLDKVKESEHERDAADTKLSRSETAPSDFEVARVATEMLKAEHSLFGASKRAKSGEERRELEVRAREQSTATQTYFEDNKEAIDRIDQILESAHKDKVLAEAAEQKYGVSGQQAFNDPDIRGEVIAAEAGRSIRSRMGKVAYQMQRAEELTEREIDALREQIEELTKRLAFKESMHGDLSQKNKELDDTAKAGREAGQQASEALRNRAEPE